MTDQALTAPLTRSEARSLTNGIQESLDEVFEAQHELDRLRYRHPDLYAQVLAERGVPAPPPRVKAEQPGQAAPVVYFVQSGEGGHIKIGTASDFPKRLQALQTGNPERLTVLGTLPGSLSEEADIHDQFSHLRARGEWFRPEPELLDYIKEACK